MVLTCTVITVLLLAWVALRTYNIVRTAVWNFSNSHKIVARVARLPEQQRYSASEHAQIISDLGGDYFPFGARPYALRDRQALIRLGPLRRTMHRLAQRAWLLPVALGGPSLYLVLIADGPAYTTGRKLLGFANLTLAVLLLLCIMAWAAGTFILFLAMPTELAVIYIGADLDIDARPVSRELEKVLLFGSQVVLSWFVLAAAIFQCSLTAGRFGKMPEGLVLGFHANLARFFDSAYFALLLLIGLTDPDATTGYAKLIVSLGALIGIGFLLVILALVISSSPFRRHI